MSVSRNLYQVLKPILVIGKIFGITSFNFNEKYYKISKLNVYVNALLCVVYLVVIGFNFYLQSSSEANVAIKTTNSIKIGAGTMLVLLAWICSGRYQKKSIFIIMRLMKIDKDMQKLGIYTDFSKILKQNYFRIVIRLLVYIVFAVFDILANEHQDNIDLMIFNSVLKVILKLPLFLNTITHLEVLTYVRIIKNNLKTLNSHLSALETTNNGFLIDTVKVIKLTTFLGTKLKSLRSICPIHHELCKLSEIITERYGIVLLMAFLNTFVYTVVNLYLCNTIWRKVVIDNKEMLTVVLNVECLIFIIETIYVCHVCDNTVEESNKSAIVIHKIETDNNSIKDQIAMFSLQIAHKRMGFSAAGLFPINYSLIFSIIGGVTANLVILIQFSAS